jgi:hypothetical protein
LVGAHLRQLLLLLLLLLVVVVLVWLLVVGCSLFVFCCTSIFLFVVSRNMATAIPIFEGLKALDLSPLFHSVSSQAPLPALQAEINLCPTAFQKLRRWQLPKYVRKKYPLAINCGWLGDPLEEVFMGKSSTNGICSIAPEGKC